MILFLLTIWMAVGFPRGLLEHAQCGIHAAYLRVVGDSGWHCEEHLPHPAARCALFQPYPYPRHCWDSLLTAVRRGRVTPTHKTHTAQLTFSALPGDLPYVSYCCLCNSVHYVRRGMTFIWQRWLKHYSKVAFSCHSQGRCSHRVSESRSSAPTEFLSTLPLSLFPCLLSHCPLFSLCIPTPAPSSFLLDLSFSLGKPKQNWPACCGVGP